MMIRPSYTEIQNKILEGKSKRQCVSISAELTSLCNFNCPMCYINDNTGRCKSIDADTWNMIFSEAAEQGLQNVLLTGGEALLYPGFEEIVLHLNTLGVPVRIKTNGVYADKNFIEFAERYGIYMVDVSLYGYDRESYLKCTGVDQFSNVYSNIRLLANSKIKVRLMVTNSKENIEQREQLRKFVEDIGCGVIVNEVPLFPPRHDIKRCYKDYFTSRYDTMLLKNAFKKDEPSTSEKHESSRIFTETEGLTCSAGKSSCAIHFDGTVTPCLNYPENKGFRKAQEGFVTAFNFLRDVTASEIYPEKCKNCPSAAVCNYCPAYSSSCGQPDDLFCSFWKE